MAAPPPRHCRHAAYARFAATVPRLDDPEDASALEHAATAVAMHAMPDLVPGATAERLDALAVGARHALRSTSLRARITHLHHHLFEVEGFAGNQADYYDPGNSHLPHVLRTRRGIPITLALVYRAVAGRLGLQVAGIGAPGHFLVRVEDESGAMLVDPFHRGRLLSEEEAFRTMEAALGAALPRRAELLEPVTPRAWIARLLRNLEAIHTRRARPRDAAAMAELRRLVEGR